MAAIGVSNGGPYFVSQVRQRQTETASLIACVLALAAGPTTKESRVYKMFLILAIVLVVMWLGGFVMFKSAGMLIHLLLLFAVISIIMHFVTGRTTA